MDGISLVHRLEDADHFDGDRALFFATHDAMWPQRERLYDHLSSKQQLAFKDQVLAVRLGNFKYVQGYGHNALHDLLNDPSESRDVSDQYPEIHEHLESQLRNWYRTVLEWDTSYAMPVFPIGLSGSDTSYAYACAPVTIEGGIISGSHATMNWSQTGDTQTILIEVITPGKYDIELETVVGAPHGEIRVSIDNQMIQAAIRDAYRQDLGTMRLTSGKHLISISLHETADDAPVVIHELRRIVFRSADSTIVP
ncbi:MAG: hypothetical protein RLN76_03130 [Phycisphaeraceae bacterium]